MTTGPAPICVECVYYKPTLRCKAFPRGIPVAILTSKADHRQPYAGDKGIRFKQNPRKRGTSGNPLLTGAEL